MFRRPIRLLVAAAACAATATLTVPTSAPAFAATIGPDEENVPTTELMGQFGPVVPLKNMAQITMTKWGIRYEAGQQGSRLKMTEVDGKVLYVDTATQKWRKLPSACVRRAVPRGIAALCTVPAQFKDKPVFLEVWPRLGNDVIDASAISARYRMWVLSDAGNDTVRTGAGNDFINGAQNRDKLYGGAGDDWIRAGKANDMVWGGDGGDYIVGQDADDTIHAGAGDDRVYGANGSDTLWAEAGEDLLVGGGGSDRAYYDDFDRVLQCESANRVS